MRISDAELEARRALLAKLDDWLRLGLQKMRGALSPDWHRREREFLTDLFKKGGK
jgi:hypothetical protein